MWSSCTVFAFVVLLLLVLVWYTSRNQTFLGASPWLTSWPGKTERFDTGYNHDVGAMADYYGPDLVAGVAAARAASERARYTWAERDPLGLTVYDRVYEQDLQKAQTVSPSVRPLPPDQLYMTESSVEQPPSSPATSVDEPFGLVNAPYSMYRVSDVFGMEAPPPSTTVNGQTVWLSQKSF